MNPLRYAVYFSFLMSVVSAQSSKPAAAGLQRLERADRPGTAWSVRVPDGPLVFTGQIYGVDFSADARQQAEQALAALAKRLRERGSELDEVVRLNAYVAEVASADVVEAVVGERFKATPVAFTLVRTPLAQKGAVVAFEAVARTSAVSAMDSAAAVLPAGGKIFISGQAEKGTDLASAVRLTMAGLHRSVAHLGLKKSDIVQVKAFIRPASDHATATREVAASFDGGAVPPTVLIEWQSELFAEIEIVVSAAALATKKGENISHAWLPWLNPSPRYCHVAQVAAGTPLIFIGSLNGGAGDGRSQMKTVFERLGSVLFESGSSYRNLAKATYYLAPGPARLLLGDIRGVYFDPMRPPAASALQVPALGAAGRVIEIDMIAVPVK